MKKIRGALQNYLSVEDTSETKSEPKFNDTSESGMYIAKLEAKQVYDSLRDVYEKIQRRVEDDPYIKKIITMDNLSGLANRIYCIQIKRDIIFNDWSLQDTIDMYPELEPAFIKKLYTSKIRNLVRKNIGDKKTVIKEKRAEIMDALKTKALPPIMRGTELRNKINYVVEGYFDVFDVDGAIAFAKEVYEATTGLKPPAATLNHIPIDPSLVSEHARRLQDSTTPVDVHEEREINYDERKSSASFGRPVPAPRKATRNTRKTSSDRMRGIEKLQRLSRRYRKQLQARSPTEIAFDKFAVNVDIARAKKDTTQQTIDATLALTEFFLELQSKQDLREKTQRDNNEIERLQKVLAELNEETI